MTDARVGERLPARCENCKSFFAAEFFGDGSIRPIGAKAGCPCGNGDLRPLR